MLPQQRGDAQELEALRRQRESGLPLHVPDSCLCRRLPRLHTKRVPQRNLVHGTLEALQGKQPASPLALLTAAPAGVFPACMLAPYLSNLHMSHAGVGLQDVRKKALADPDGCTHVVQIQTELRQGSA